MPSRFPSVINKEISQIVKQAVPEIHDEGDEVRFGSTKVVETLDVTEAKQYRERGLIHIGDNTYRFFMAIDIERLKLINNHKLKEQKENLIKVAKCTLKNNQELQAKWLACFQEDERTGNEVIYFRSSGNCEGVSEVGASFTFTLKQLYQFFYVHCKSLHFD